MTVEREHCFDPVTQMNCDPTRDPNPLGRYRTVFFAVQPKYLNVDIRIILDVTRGSKFQSVWRLYKVLIDNFVWKLRHLPVNMIIVTFVACALRDKSTLFVFDQLLANINN